MATEKSLFGWIDGAVDVQNDLYRSEYGLEGKRLQRGMFIGATADL